MKAYTLEHFVTKVTQGTSWSHTLTDQCKADWDYLDLIIHEHPNPKHPVGLDGEQNYVDTYHMKMLKAVGEWATQGPKFRSSLYELRDIFCNSMSDAISPIEAFACVHRATLEAVAAETLGLYKVMALAIMFGMDRHMHIERFLHVFHAFYLWQDTVSADWLHEERVYSRCSDSAPFHAVHPNRYLDSWNENHYAGIDGDSWDLQKLMDRGELRRPKKTEVASLRKKFAGFTPIECVDDWFPPTVESTYRGRDVTRQVVRSVEWATIMAMADPFCYRYSQCLPDPIASCRARTTAFRLVEFRARQLHEATCENYPTRPMYQFFLLLAPNLYLADGLCLMKKEGEPKMAMRVHRKQNATHGITCAAMAATAGLKEHEGFPLFFPRLHAKDKHSEALFSFLARRFQSGAAIVTAKNLKDICA